MTFVRMTITASVTTSTVPALNHSDHDVGDFHEFIETEHHSG